MRRLILTGFILAVILIAGCNRTKIIVGKPDEGYWYTPQQPERGIRYTGYFADSPTCNKLYIEYICANQSNLNYNIHAETFIVNCSKDYNQFSLLGCV